MSGEHEYAFWPWVIPWLRPGGYSMRPCDIPQDRFLDTTEVQDTTEAPWQDSPVKDEFVRLPVPWRRWSNGGPRTMVTAHPTVREKWTIGTSQYGYYDAWLPVPKTGSHREENNPRPLWQMASSNHYDKHEIFVHEDGRVTEVIGVTNWGMRRAAGLGRWLPDGTLAYPDQDRGVVWSKTQMSKHMLAPQDVLPGKPARPHRLALVVKGSDLAEPSFPWWREVLALDPAKAPTGLPTMAQRIVDMLVTHGCMVTDHGGNSNISYAAGSQWDGIDWGGWRLRLADLRLVTA